MKAITDRQGQDPRRERLLRLIAINRRCGYLASLVTELVAAGNGADAREVSFPALCSSCTYLLDQ